MAKNRFDLLASARAEMIERGFHPDVPDAVREQLAKIGDAPVALSHDTASRLVDLRELPWSSIDNSSSKDLDQIEVAERAGDSIRLRIGVADVDARVPVGSAIDQRAAAESISVYVPGHVFPMIPVELSEGSTSLRPGEDRLAVVIDLLVDAEGMVVDSKIIHARVRNHVQLSYGRVGAWLDQRGAVPSEIADSLEMQAQLHLQDEAARRLRERRYREGALQFDRSEAFAVFEEGKIRGIELRHRNRAADLIEDLMIAANEAIAETLTRCGIPSIRRVVKSPARWPRIVQLAAQRGSTLPEQAEPGPLAAFLRTQKTNSPDDYAELSLAVLKLMGPGEYLVLRAGEEALGHFGLAATDYTHSTAPNRRFADLVTQRQMKSLIEQSPTRYDDAALDVIARTCTAREDAARAVERAMHKRAIAFALRVRVGQTFRALITGVTPKGVFARVADPPVEGRVVRGEKGLDVGDRVRLKLIKADALTGFIDFAR